MVTGVHHISMKCGSDIDLQKTKEFYVDLLGFKLVRTWPEGIMLDAGNDVDIGL